MYNFQLTLATKKRAIVDCLIMAVEHGPFHFGNKCTRQAMVGGHGKFLASTSFFFRSVDWCSHKRSGKMGTVSDETMQTQQITVINGNLYDPFYF